MTEHAFTPFHSEHEHEHRAFGYFTAHCSCGWIGGDVFYGRPGRTREDALAVAEDEWKLHTEGKDPADAGGNEGRDRGGGS